MKDEHGMPLDGNIKNNKPPIAKRGKQPVQYNAQDPDDHFIIWST